MHVREICYATKLTEHVVVVLDRTTVVQKIIHVALGMGIVTMTNNVLET